jgi:transglutaminase-like putative cysteine protease
MAVASRSTKNIKTTQHILSTIAGVIIIVPLAPLICRFIPPVMLGSYNIDLFLSVLIAIVIVRLMIWLVRPLIIPALLLLLGLLIFNQFAGRYGFANIFNDYKTIAYSNWQVREEKQTDLLSISPGLFENANSKGTREIRSKVQLKDSLVRNFAVKHSLEYFKEYQAKYGMLTRYLSLFKYINRNFNYVPDARRDEYFATARETITNGLGGDCDDHSILMASCMMSIGAKCRLVIVDGHMYPELYAGDKDQFEVVQQAIVQLFSDQRITNIFYHESGGDYWINLDYTARHPGGYYMNDKLRLIIDL